MIALFIVDRVWDRYDGMIIKQPSFHVLDLILDNEPCTETTNDDTIALLAFLPQVDDICFNVNKMAARDVSVEAALRQISRIQKCMMKSTTKMTAVSMKM